MRMYRMIIAALLIVIALCAPAGAKQYRTASEVEITYDVADLNSVKPGATIGATLTFTPTAELTTLRYWLANLSNVTVTGATATVYKDLPKGAPVRARLTITVLALPARFIVHYATATTATSAMGNKTFYIGQAR